MALAPADARRIREHIDALPPEEVDEAIATFDDMADVLWHLCGLLDDRVADLQDEQAED